MTLAEYAFSINSPNTKYTREGDWNYRDMISCEHNTMVRLVCRTYPVHPAIIDISGGPTRFPRIFDLR